MRLAARGHATALAAILALTAAATASLPQPRDFAGKYSFDRIAGLRLVDLPVVRKALAAAVYNQTVLSAIGKDGVASPIEYSQGLTYSSTCEPHNCSSHNWAFVVSDEPHKAAACYHDGELMDGSRWFVGGSVTAKILTDCGGGLPELPQRVASMLRR